MTSEVTSQVKILPGYLMTCIPVLIIFHCPLKSLLFPGRKETKLTCRPACSYLAAGKNCPTKRTFNMVTPLRTHALYPYAAFPRRAEKSLCAPARCGTSSPKRLPPTESGWTLVQLSLSLPLAEFLRRVGSTLRRRGVSYKQLPLSQLYRSP